MANDIDPDETPRQYGASHLDVSFLLMLPCLLHKCINIAYIEF